MEEEVEASARVISVISDSKREISPRLSEGQSETFKTKATFKNQILLNVWRSVMLSIPIVFATLLSYLN